MQSITIRHANFQKVTQAAQNRIEYGIRSILYRTSKKCNI